MCYSKTIDIIQNYLHTYVIKILMTVTILFLYIGQINAATDSTGTPISPPKNQIDTEINNDANSIDIWNSWGHLYQSLSLYNTSLIIQNAILNRLGHQKSLIDQSKERLKIAMNSSVSRGGEKRDFSGWKEEIRSDMNTKVRYTTDFIYSIIHREFNIVAGTSYNIPQLGNSERNKLRASLTSAMIVFRDLKRKDDMIAAKYFLDELTRQDLVEHRNTFTKSNTKLEEIAVFLTGDSGENTEVQFTCSVSRDSLIEKQFEPLIQSYKTKMIEAHTNFKKNHLRELNFAYSGNNVFNDAVKAKISVLNLQIEEYTHLIEELWDQQSKEIIQTNPGSPAGNSEPLTPMHRGAGSYEEIVMTEEQNTANLHKSGFTSKPSQVGSSGPSYRRTSKFYQYEKRILNAGDAMSKIQNELYPMKCLDDNCGLVLELLTKKESDNETLESWLKVLNLQLLPKQGDIN